MALSVSYGPNQGFELAVRVIHLSFYFSIFDETKMRQNVQRKFSNDISKLVRKQTIRIDQLVKRVSTQGGNDALQDYNSFCYVNNGRGAVTSRWHCAKRTCPATLTGHNSTSKLTNADLPEHNHTKKVMKIAAQETDEAVFNHFATLQDTTTSAVLQEISSNMLSSNFLG